MEKFRKNLLLINSSIYIALFILIFTFIPKENGLINVLFAAFIAIWVIASVFAVFDNKENKELIRKFIFEWVLIFPFLIFVLLCLLKYYFHFLINIKPNYLEVWSTIITFSSITLFFITGYLIVEKIDFIKNNIKKQYDSFRSSLRNRGARLILFFGFCSIFSICFKLPIDITSAVSAIFLIILDKDYSKLKNWEVLSKSPESEKAFMIEKEDFFNKITLVIIASSTIISDKIIVISQIKNKDDKLFPFKIDISGIRLIIFAILLIIAIFLLRYLDRNVKKPNNQ